MAAQTCLIALAASLCLSGCYTNRPLPPSPPSPPTPPTPPRGPHVGYCDQEGWDRVWQDEFDDKSLFENNWNVMVGWNSDDGTLRSAIGTEDDVYLSNGELVLRTREKDGKYYSGAVVSGSHHGGLHLKPKGTADHAWKYGRFCVLAKLPGQEPQPQTSTRPSNCSTLMQDTDVMGAGAVGDHPLSASDVGQCCEFCQDHAQCSYFVYLKGDSDCDVGCCYMKTNSATGFNKSAPGRITGFVPGAEDRSLGIWPGHWMMPDVDSDCWPQTGEIDIMEMINGDGQYRGTYHWSGDGQCSTHEDVSNGTTVPAPTTWASEYHEYAVEWTEDHIHFVVDGEVQHTVQGDAATFPTDNMYLLLNTAMGNSWSWSGPPGPNTVLPTYHHIDYVRVAKPKPKDLEV